MNENASSLDTKQGALLVDHFIETSLRGRQVHRMIRIGDKCHSNYISLSSELDAVSDPRLSWDLAYLRGGKVIHPASTREVRIVDLFCGCGGFAWGFAEGLRQQGVKPVITHAFDLDNHALSTYIQNLKPHEASQDSVAMLVDYSMKLLDDPVKFSYPPEILDEHISLRSEKGKTDYVIAGPPCQGHSNFNNYTRRKDPRNLLYLTTVAVAVALRSQNILIENVAEVQNDHFMVVSRARQLLEASGYFVEEIILEGPSVGLPQTRKRFFLLASLNSKPRSMQVIQAFRVNSVRTVLDAIGDLQVKTGSDLYNSPPSLSRENKKRIDWLFSNNAYNLANDQRPDCHKDGHTYPSVYGRLYPDQPAGTITTGLNSPGRGRYIHPCQPRMITPHEAARLQSISDAFCFHPENGRNSLAKLIGDAVPPLFGEILSMAFR